MRGTTIHSLIAVYFLPFFFGKNWETGFFSQKQYNVWYFGVSASADFAEPGAELDFNNYTGALSNYTVIKEGPEYRAGLSFSLNGNLLYLATGYLGPMSLYQFDLCSSNPMVSARK